MILQTATERTALLRVAKTVAVIGASGNPARPSYFVLRYLRGSGYTVRPVNPSHRDVDGLACYPSLTKLVTAHGIPDVADVFRRPEALPELVEEAIALRIPALWFQYGVVNQAAIERADRAGITVVADRCIKVEHARFSSGLSSQGFNSGIITARRRAG